MFGLQAQIQELESLIGNLPPYRQSFAQSLCQQFWERGRLSARQAPFVTELIGVAKAAEEPKAQYEARPTMDVGGMAGVIGLFDKAREKLKQPKIVLSLDDGTEFRLSIAGARAFAPGSLNVTDLRAHPSNTWFGRVYRDGRFEPSPRTELPDGLVALLEQFSKDPAGMAARHGKLHGKCCFCDIALTDPRSTAAGYGPVCADKWGMKDQWKAAVNVLKCAA